MKIQFLYHPENDNYIASSILQATKIKPIYSLANLKISDIDSYNDNLKNSILTSDVLILLVSTTFKKIAPIIWMNAIQNKKAIFAIDVHSISDEWGKTRKKSPSLSLKATYEDSSLGDIFPVYQLPSNSDGLNYISEYIDSWCVQAVKSAKNNYGLSLQGT